MNIHDILLEHGFKKVSLNYFKQDTGDRSLFAYWNIVDQKYQPEKSHRTLIKVEHSHYNYLNNCNLYTERLFQLTEQEAIEIIKTLAPIHNFEELQTVLLSLPHRRI